MACSFAAFFSRMIEALAGEEKGVVLFGTARAFLDEMLDSHRKIILQIETRMDQLEEQKRSTRKISSD